ncbi:hypothetical protein MPTK1_2g02220 [Marchantia polymorpha subsp. ruderalis]|uniref:Uncharacterized protein n=1 Tax=Marchantia polymorpha TaxID=3197 RepID=A0A2R6W887_MARPO|nr:hypothetical protein MARPO_0130s0029 [Marchantia polymorpha]BBN00797.1 hypothetical protein Mp_2g02220 [Marchantia polymorpha subsp. ruderalis]|eukprot:PTQ30074.1 hypothetical protein MARPO_0130s0029 [Marchantia polymorpha]
MTPGLPVCLGLGLPRFSSSIRSCKVLEGIFGNGKILGHVFDVTRSSCLSHRSSRTPRACGTTGFRIRERRGEEGEDYLVLYCPFSSSASESDPSLPHHDDEENEDSATHEKGRFHSWIPRSTLQQFNSLANLTKVWLL